MLLLLYSYLNIHILHTVLEYKNKTLICDYISYRNGSQCQPKKNYTDSCSDTYECRDFDSVNLVCRVMPIVPPIFHCLCNSTSFWEPCLDRCITTKKVSVSELVIV